MHLQPATEYLYLYLGPGSVRLFMVLFVHGLTGRIGLPTPRLRPLVLCGCECIFQTNCKSLPNNSASVIPLHFALSPGKSPPCVTSAHIWAAAPCMCMPFGLRVSDRNDSDLVFGCDSITLVFSVSKGRPGHQG